MKYILAAGVLMLIAYNAAGLPSEYKVGSVNMAKLYDTPTCRVFQDCWVDFRSNLAKRKEYNDKFYTHEIAQQIEFLQQIVDQEMTALRLVFFTEHTKKVTWVRVTTKDGIVHRCRVRQERDPASSEPPHLKKKTYVVILLPEKYMQQRLVSLTLEGGEK